MRKRVWVEVPRAALCACEAVCEALVPVSADAILLADPPHVAQVDGIRDAPLVSVVVVFVEEVAQHAWVLSGDEVVPSGAKGTVRIGVLGLEHVLAADAAAELCALVESRKALALVHAIHAMERARVKTVEERV